MSHLLLDLAGIRARGIPFTRQHIHRLIRQGKFPRPIKIGLNTNAWPAADIDSYIAALIAERDNQSPAEQPTQSRKPRQAASTRRRDNAVGRSKPVTPRPK